VLDAAEQRVHGSQLEKEITVPASIPWPSTRCASHATRPAAESSSLARTRTGGSDATGA